MITVGDILAAQDVLTAVINDADGYNLDEAITLREALGALSSELKRAEGAITTKVREELEALKQPRQVGDRLYLMKPDSTPRHDHLAILRAVVERVSAATADGEVPTAFEAATKAAFAVRDLFVAPRDKAKVGELKKLLGPGGLKKVTTYEPASDKLEVIDLRARTEEDDDV
jgi:hypothetical protein